MSKFYYSLVSILLLFNSLSSFGQSSEWFADHLKEGVVLQVKSPILIRANKSEKSLSKIHSTAPPYFMGTITYTGKMAETNREIPTGHLFKIVDVDRIEESGKILNKHTITLHLDSDEVEKIDIYLLVNQPFDEFLKNEDSRMENLNNSFLKYFEINPEVSEDHSSKP